MTDFKALADAITHHLNLSGIWTRCDGASGEACPVGYPGEYYLWCPGCLARAVEKALREAAGMTEGER